LFATLGEAVYGMAGEALPATSSEAGSAAARVIEAGRAPVHLPASPLMHGTGMFSSFQALLGGGTIVTLAGRTFDPHELWRMVEREHVTQMAIVGDAFCKPMLVALREAEAEGRSYDTSSLGLVISSGVMWSADVKRELMERVGCICFDSLGSSEGVGFANSISVPGSEAATAKFTIGSQTKVLTEDGREVEPGSGEIGMLSLGGHIPLGYYKDEAKSAGTFRVLNGRRWSIPGDFASVEADGTITLLGRGSVVINSGGEKIFPEEVEEAVKQHPAVLDALVVGVPDERFGEAVTAVVTLHPGVDATPSELSAALVALSRFKHPRKWVIVEEILRAPNGKADYKLAKAKALEA
jgi:fatty-acyl-CoA synthase